MRIIQQLFHSLFSPLDAQQQAEQDYLAKAVDSADFERRMYDLAYHSASSLQGASWADFAQTQSLRRPW